MKKNYVLLFHPNLAHSRVNRQLATALAVLPDTEVIDYYQLYPDGQIDYMAERNRLLNAASVVLQFPLYWYATPPLLKAWCDQILTRMYYVEFETSGAQLNGLSIMLAVSAGNTAEAYSEKGANGVSLEQLLLPLRITAKRCGWQWQPPCYVFSANHLSEQALNSAVHNTCRAVIQFHLLAGR